MDKRIHHLQMIQGVVNRLSQNSFLLKGWSVVLISALFALAAGSKSKILFIYIAYFPAIAFWILDGYFLWQERLFRALYDHVRQINEEQVDFSMDTSIVRNQVKTWCKVILSMTLLIFHGTVLGAIVIITILGKFTNTGG